MKHLSAIAMAGVGAALVALAPTAQATDGPAPVRVDGNPGCPAGDTALKVERGSEAGYAGAYDGPFGARVTISQVDATAHTFSFASTVPVHQVIAKGGPMANLYSFPGGATSGAALHPPVNGNGNGGPKFYGISHIIFCFATPSAPPGPPQPEDGRIVIDEVTVPGAAQAAFAFTPSTGAPFTLTDAQAPRSTGVPPGTYTVAQGALAGWPLIALSCSDADSAADRASATATIVVSPGETVTCVFTNARVVAPPPGPGTDPPPTHTVPPPVDTAPPPTHTAPPTADTTPPAGTTTGPTTDPTPGAGSSSTSASGGGVATPASPGLPKRPVVLGSRARSSSATLLVPGACVARSFTVAIRGRGIARIVVAVNGRRAAIAHGRPGRRDYRVAVPVRGSGPQSVVATVSFAAGNAPRRRTLRTTAFRCTPRVVRPQFTG